MQAARPESFVHASFEVLWSHGILTSPAEAVKGQLAIPNLHSPSSFPYRHESCSFSASWNVQQRYWNHRRAAEYWSHLLNRKLNSTFLLNLTVLLDRPNF